MRLLHQTPFPINGNVIYGPHSYPSPKATMWISHAVTSARFGGPPPRHRDHWFTLYSHLMHHGLDNRAPTLEWLGLVGWGHMAVKFGESLGLNVAAIANIEEDARLGPPRSPIHLRSSVTGAHGGKRKPFCHDPFDTSIQFNHKSLDLNPTLAHLGTSKRLGRRTAEQRTITGQAERKWRPEFTPVDRKQVEKNL